MGGVSSFFSAVNDVFSGAVDTVSNVVSDVGSAVSDLGSSIDDTVNDVIPGGWGTVAAVTAATMGMPGVTELGSAAEAAGATGAAEAAGAGLSDLALAEAADAGLAGVGTNVGAGLSDLALAQAADAGLTNVGANLGLSPMELAAASDAGLTNVGANLGLSDAELAAAYDANLTGAGAGMSDAALAEAADAGLAGVGSNVGASTGLGSLLSNFLGNRVAGSLTGGGLLAGLGGIAGIKALMDADKSRYGVPGRRDWAGPLGSYKFSPAFFQPTIANPAMFRPTGVQTAKQGYASGGSTKPSYTAKSKLAAMDPWSRSVAELNNVAYTARMPVAASAPQGGIAQLGQFAAGGMSDLGDYSDGGRLLRGGGDGVSDSIPATIGGRQPARLADGEFVIPARIVSELGNGSTEAGARQLYAMMDRVQNARAKTTGKGKVAKDTDAAKHLPA